MSEVRKVVTGGIHSFLVEIMRVSKTSLLHYSVKQSPHGYLIEHHGGRWRVYVDGWEARVESDDGHILTVAQEMLLDGEKAEEICAPGYRCFTAKDVLRLMACSIALWYWHMTDPHALRLFIRLVGSA